MDNFRIIYKMLSILEESLDEPQADQKRLSAEALDISEERRKAYLEMLTDAGYIKGVEIREYRGGGSRVSTDGIRITLKGLEYLSENTIMQKMYRTVRGITDLIP